MLKCVPMEFDRAHPIGVVQILTVRQLVDIATNHRKEKGDRYCPFFVSMPGGIRLLRFVTVYPGNLLVIQSDFGTKPEEVPIEQAEHSKYLGRYLQEGRLFYDSLSLELPDVLPTKHLSAMQRLS